MPVRVSDCLIYVFSIGFATYLTIPDRELRKIPSMFYWLFCLNRQTFGILHVYIPVLLLLTLLYIRDDYALIDECLNDGKNDDAILGIALLMIIGLLKRSIPIRVSINNLDDTLSQSWMHILPLKVTVYSEDDNISKFDQNFYQSKYKNVRFFLIQHAENELHYANDAEIVTAIFHAIKSLSNDSSTKGSILSLQLITDDHNTSLSENPSFLSKHGFSVKNIEEIDQNFICPSCRLVLQQPYKLSCGHRQCQSCIGLKNK